MIKKPLYAGRLISIEGIDGSGKTTLAKCIAHELEKQGFKTLCTQEPGGTDLGTTLRHILHTQKAHVCDVAEFLLFAADRAQHFHQIIVPALQDGTIVISDRLADSSLAYQGYGRGLDRAMITTVNQWAMQNLIPDATLFLRIEPDKALSRVLGRKEELTSFEQEKLNFWHRVADGYEKIFAARTNVIMLDATQSQETLCKQAMQALLKHIHRT
jgi:dTMP kinase